MRYSQAANRILAGVCILFIGAAVLRRQNPDNLLYEMLLMVSEAALVGGIADWFAVTALFRRPLGFPWHTALIPRNRERVIQAVVNTVEHELLSVTAIERRLAAISFMDIGIDWLENRGGQAVVGRWLTRTALGYLASVDTAALTSRAEQLMRRYARRLVLAPRWAALGQWALEQQKTERIFNLILDELTDILKKPGTLAAICRYLHKVKGKRAGSLAAKVIFWLGEQTDSINLREAARALQQELITALDELRAPEHPLNRWAVGRIAEMIHNLENEPALQEAVISWAEMIVSRASLGGFVEQAVCSLTAVLREWEEGGGREIRHMPPLLRYVAAQIAGYWDSFKENAELKHWVDQFIRQALLRLIATEHHIIGGIVREALEAFGDEDLSAFIEEKAGDDLQWIRINGSVVGGIVGLLLFLFLRFVYDPMITPHIKSWL